MEFIYQPIWAGCIVSFNGLMTTRGRFILYPLPDLGVIKGSIGLILRIVGTVFFGSALLSVLAVILGGNTMLTVEDRQLKSNWEKKRRHSLPEGNIEQ